MTGTVSHVATGGGRGIGRAMVERLLLQGAPVTVLDLEPATLAWIVGHPAVNRPQPVTSR